MTSAASDCAADGARRREALSSFSSVSFRSTLFSFWKVGILLGILSFGQRAPSVFIFVFFPLTISMPTVTYPLYFRYVLNSLYLFLVLCFCLKKKKRNSEGCHVCPPCFMQTGCHFTTSATFWALSVCLQCFGCDTKSKKGGGGDVSIASERLRYP